MSTYVCIRLILKIFSLIKLREVTFLNFSSSKLYDTLAGSLSIKRFFNILNNQPDDFVIMYSTLITFLHLKIEQFHGKRFTQNVLNISYINIIRGRQCSYHFSLTFI